MGNCLLGESPFHVLRFSLPGSLLPSEGDFRDFYSICKTETHTLSSQLVITPTVSFFVVVSGEVQISVSNTVEKQSEIVSIALPGEMIMFFGVNKTATISNGSLELGELRVSLNFRSSEGLAQVIGSDYQAIQHFLDSRPYLNALHSLFDIKLEPFLASKGLLSLKEYELQALAPLLRIRSARGGQVLRYALKDDASRYLHLLPEENVAMIVPPIADNAVGLLLTGSGMAVPSGSDLSDIIHEKRAQQIASGVSPINSYTNKRSYSSVSGSGTIRPGEKRSILGHIRAYLGGRSQQYAEIQHLQGIPELFTPELKAELVKLYPGSIFGLEQHTIRKVLMGLDSIVSLESSLIGYIEFEALQFMFKLDKRLKRVVQRNFLKSVLDSVRQVVPMLSEMEDKGYVLLSTLISVRYFNKDDEVFTKGSASDNSYIVVRGLIKEWEDKDGDTLKPEQQEEHDENNDQVRYLGYGNLFGEVSLVTDSPYFTSTRAVEPSLLVCINRRAFDRIFNNDKAKLAEIRIRLVGMDVEIQHILNHPMGNRLLLDFLGKEMATENIYFLNAVARFEDICDRLRRELNKIQLQHQQHQEVMKLMRHSSFKMSNGTHAHSQPVGGVADADTALMTTSPTPTSSHHPRGSGNPHTNGGNSGHSSHSLGLSHPNATANGSGHAHTDQPIADSSEMSYLRCSFSCDEHNMDVILASAPVMGAQPSLVIDFMENLEKMAAAKRASAATNNVGIVPETISSATSWNNLNEGNESTTTSTLNVIGSPSNNRDVGIAEEKCENNGEKMTSLAAGSGPSSASLNRGQSSNNSSPDAHHRTPTAVQSNGHHHHPSRPSVERSQITTDAADASQVFNFDTNQPVTELTANEYSVLVLQQYHKLQKNITELKEVARKVIDKHLRMGSESEINVSSACRNATNEQYLFWTKMSAHDSLRQLQQQQLEPQSPVQQNVSSAASQSQFTVGQHSFLDESLPPRAAGNHGAQAAQSATSLGDFTQLFKRSRHDITQLLQKDAFVRFRHTNEFKSFIQAIRPFDQQPAPPQSPQHTQYHHQTGTWHSSGSGQHESVHGLAEGNGAAAANGAGGGGESSVHSTPTNVHRLSFHRKPNAASSFTSLSATSGSICYATHPRDSIKSQDSDSSDSPKNSPAVVASGPSQTVAMAIAQVIANLLPNTVEEREEKSDLISPRNQSNQSNQSSGRKQSAFQKLSVAAIAPSG